MNLIQIADHLKNIPLPVLNQYKNGSNPDVPPYMAAAEMQRRDTMMKQYQNAQAKAPQNTVVDGLENQLTGKQPPPQMGGIAAGMPQQAPQQAPQSPPPSQGMTPPQQMNSGGIAGFAAGGQAQQAAQIAKLMAALQQQQGQDAAPSQGAQQVAVAPSQPIKPMAMKNFASMASGTMPSGPPGTGAPINQDLTLDQIQQSKSGLPIVAAHGGLMMHHVPHHMYNFVPGGIIGFAGQNGSAVPDPQDFQDPEATVSDNSPGLLSTLGSFLAKKIGLGEGLKINPKQIMEQELNKKNLPPNNPVDVNAEDIPSGPPAAPSPPANVPLATPMATPKVKKEVPAEPTGIATQLPPPKSDVTKASEEMLKEGLKKQNAEDEINNLMGLKEKLGVTGEAGDALLEQAMEAHRRYQNADHSMERLQKILAAQAYGGFRAVGAADVDYQEKQRMADQAESEKYLERLMQSKMATRGEKMGILTNALKEASEHNKAASTLGQAQLKNEDESRRAQLTHEENVRNNNLVNNYRMGELSLSKQRLYNELAHQGFSDKDIIAKIQDDAKSEGKPISFTEAYKLSQLIKNGVGSDKNDITRINDTLKNLSTQYNETYDIEEKKKIAAAMDQLRAQLMQRTSPQATSYVPTLSEFLTKAKQYNPGMTDDELTSKYKVLYPNVR
jgi:hypothetical protein